MNVINEENKSSSKTTDVYILITLQNPKINAATEPPTQLRRRRRHQLFPTTTLPTLLPPMAKRALTIFPSPLISLLKVLNPNQLRPLSAAGDGVFKGPTNPNSKERDEQIRKLRILIQESRFETALKLIKTLIESKTVFLSAIDVFDQLSASNPALKREFASVVVSAFADPRWVMEDVGFIRVLWDHRVFFDVGRLNSVLECLVRVGKFGDGMRLFDEAVGFGVDVDVFSYGKAVQCCVKMNDLRKGVEILRCMERRRRIGVSVFAYNVLINGFCKEKRMSEARSLFDEMVDRKLVPSQVTYNTLIDGYCKVGDLEKAFAMRERMKSENVAPSALTFNSLLHGLCKARRMDEMDSVLEEMKSHRFAPDAFTYSTLLDGHARCGNVEAMLSLFEEVMGKGNQAREYACAALLNGLCKEGMMEKADMVLEKLLGNGMVAPNEFLYNTILKGYCLANNVEKALTIFERMDSSGLQPTRITFNTMIKKFCEMGDMDEAEEWMNKMGDKGVKPSVDTYNTMIDGYGRQKMFERCFQILEEIKNRNLKPDVISYGSLINCLCQDGRLLEAEVLLRDMMAGDIQPNVRIYNMLIVGYCNSGKVEKAFKFLDEMPSHEIMPSVVTYNALIKGLCGKGRLHEAEDLATEITNKGLNRDVITYNSLIQGYVGIGNVSKALELYETMKSAGIKPSLQTYHPLISACAKGGLTTVEKIYKEMRGFNIAPDRLIYNALIHAYAEHEFDKAIAFRDEMIDQRIDLDKMTYNSLIWGHLKVGKVQEVLELVNDMKARGLTIKADTYTLLIEGYCKLKDFGGAYAWFVEMADNGFLLTASICRELINGLKEEGLLREVELIYSRMSAASSVLAPKIYYAVQLPYQCIRMWKTAWYPCSYALALHIQKASYYSEPLEYQRVKAGGCREIHVADTLEVRISRHAQRVCWLKWSGFFDMNISVDKWSQVSQLTIGQ
ncbi:Pentatricopeptide repeat-containing protein [Drosera capensis]